MPNIEIHGLHEQTALDVEKKIFAAFSDEPYIDEIVVTRFPTVATDKKGVSQPFLRLVNDSWKDVKEIIAILDQFGLDIEFARLEAFHPKTTVS